MKGGFKDKMDTTDNRYRKREYKADRGAYYKVPTGYAGYRITPYKLRMPEPDRYVRRVPVERRERAVKKFSYEKWIYGTFRASRYGAQ
jgi:hypothetical protein